MGQTDNDTETNNRPPSVDNLADCLNDLTLKGVKEEYAPVTENKSNESSSQETTKEKEAPDAKPTADDPVTLGPKRHSESKTDEPATDEEIKLNTGKDKTISNGNDEESDEDNEEVGSQEEDFKTRGPCRHSGGAYNNSSRYNPMRTDQHSKTNNITSVASPVAATAAVSEWNHPMFSAPLTPPYSLCASNQDDSYIDPLLIPGGTIIGSSCSVGLYQQPQYSPQPGYDTPLYNSPSYNNSSEYSTGYGRSANTTPPQLLSPCYSEAASSNYNTSPDYNSSYSPCSYSEGALGGPYSSGNNNTNSLHSSEYGVTASPLSLSTDADDLNALEFVTQQLRGELISSSYLDALEDAVAKTVSSPITYSSSEDEDNNSCRSPSVEHIIDGICGIDPTELDYIAPSTPLHGGNIEEELALSAEQCAFSEQPSHSPPLSPSSDSGNFHSPSPKEGAISKSSSKGGRGVVGKKAVSAIKKLCNDEIVRSAIMRVACQRYEDLCRKDPDGDTCFMIVVCKPSDSPNFYENMFVLQQHLQNVRVCCDSPFDKHSDSCPQCGSKPDQWRTPLSEKNIAGDTVLSCAAKMHHPEKVINYLVTGIARCQADIKRVFDSEGAHILTPYANVYPVLKRFL